jgi:hypothetical protein
MIEHGKRVIVIGHKALYHQYAGGTTDPQVDDFFKNVLKIQYLGRQSVSGEKSYVCYGTENDTISDWQVKWFNMHNWENGSSWMFVNDLDVFKITDKSKSFPVDCFNYGCQCEDSYHSGEDYTYYYNKGIVDSLVGMKCWAKTGKAVFFSNRFENGWQFESIPFLAQEILAAVRWCYLGLPAPEAALIFSVNEINFSGVPLGDSLTKDITVTNYGRTPLVVNDVFVDDLEVGAFILLTPGAFTLQPLQSKKLQVRFKPTEQRKYLDAITFLSNASNGGQISLDLKGVGGSAGGPGPILTVNAKLDFGSVRGGMVKVMGIDLRNTGSSELLAQKMELTDNDDGAFGFNKTADSKVPFYISPDSIHRINIKFMPKVTEPGKKYTAKLRIESNDVQGDITVVTLEGLCALPSPKVFSRDTNLVFGYVQKSLSKTLDFIIVNSGNAKLTIDSVVIPIIPDMEGVWTFENKPSLPADISFNTGDELKFTVKFIPNKEDSTLFQSSAIIYSNDSETPQYYIRFSGFGTPLAGIEDDEHNSANELISLSASPNPFDANTIINYTLKGTQPKHLELYVTDLLGNKISELICETLSPGTYSTVFNAAKLASGKYIIIANAGGKTVVLPVILNK